jgi:peptide deformylase
MKIITVPHPTLRVVAEPVTQVNDELKKFVVELQDTLAKKANPKGVGLAAPQVNKKLNIFVTQLDDEGTKKGPPSLKVYINPRIIDQSEHRIVGPNDEEAVLEGCLSIPGIYGPVPRHEWVKLEFQEITGDELVTQTGVFEQFAARVVQHELDHLHGILFIDYTLKYDLPLYQENKKTKKLKEISEELIEALVQKTKV